MFRRKKKAPSNPEVRRAVADRDELLAAVDEAVKKVDELKDALLREYEEANGMPHERSR